MVAATRPTATPPGRPSSPSRGPVAHHRVAVRRRRVVLGLSLLAIAGLVAAVVSGTAVAWAAAATIMALTAAYVATLCLIRHRRARREWEPRHLGIPDSLAAWPELEDLALRTPTNGDDGPVPVAPPSGSLARFLVADTIGWLLAPLVFALDLLLRRTPADSASQQWLANLHRAQDQLKDRSLRALAVGAVTTAGVTAAGVTGSASAAPVDAAPVPAAAPVVSSAPLPTAGPTATYTVEAGDTLGAIAADHSTTVAALAALNHLANPNLITVGEILDLAGGGGAPTASGSYTVEAGDTLGAIAASHGTTVAALAALNDLADPNLITVGQVLRLSGTAVAVSDPAPRAATGTYTVEAGDTLGAIAASHGTTVAALAALNDLANPNLITVGEVLKLSGTAVTVSDPAPRAVQTVAAPLSGAALAVHTALAQLGKPYVWGGAGPSSFDCSGLVMYAWAAAGVQLPHYTVSQMEDTIRITASELRPGDLIFYDTGDGAQPGHVTMYIGDGEVVTADHSGTPVRIESTTWDGPIMAYGRVR